MKKMHRMLVALCLVLSLLFTGCGVVDFGGFFDRLGAMLGGNYLTPFEDMEYTRPDMDVFQEAYDTGVKAAAEQKNLNKLLQAISNFNMAYDEFYTNYALANIHYSKDLRDTYWEAEYSYCLEQTAAVSSALDTFYRALAKSPLREKLESDQYFGKDFFKAYEGESLYDDYFNSLLSQEAQLQSRYYAISGESAEAEYYSEEYFSVYGKQLADVYVELIKVRQKMAAHAGYDSYPEFAYDFYFGRDYSCQEATAYMADIRAELVPLYQQLRGSDVFSQVLAPATEAETFRYVKTMAEAMGGSIKNAFSAMEQAKLYDITYSPYKADTSFEIFLSKYFTPYVFLNPTNTNMDKLTFAHEFGHFYADYQGGGIQGGVDVAEVFSQGMEYLSLCFVEDAALKKLKMASCLSVYVEQSAYASFEQQVYLLEGEELTAQNVQALYERIALSFGFDEATWDSRDFVCIPHFFISPMYVISYVVSNDLALQLYMKETEQKGSGMGAYSANIGTMETGIQIFAQTAGLKSPFADGWLQTVKQTLEKELQ